MAKPAKKSDAGIPMTIRVPPDLYAAAVAAAEADDRTVNSFAIKAMREKLERDGEKKGGR